MVNSFDLLSIIVTDCIFHFTFIGLTRGKYLGCFRDESSKRLLNGAYYNSSIANSQSHCLQRCLLAGFSYAGVQFGWVARIWFLDRSVLTALSYFSSIQKSRCIVSTLEVSLSLASVDLYRSFKSRKSDVVIQKFYAYQLLAGSCVCCQWNSKIIFIQENLFFLENCFPKINRVRDFFILSK